MRFRYGILGSGRQGVAAAYDLAVRGDADRIVLADVDADAARAGAERVNDLAGRPVAEPAGVDVRDRRAVADLVRPLDAFLAAVSYRFNVGIAGAAIEARTHMCDLGGNVEIVRKQLALDDRARAAGACVVPDCGEAPGMANNLLAYAMSLLDRTDELVLYDGGIPRDPTPPWNYELTFNVDGLTNEYQGTTTFLRGGRPVEVECLDPAHDELVDFGPPFGVLEAFVAATASTVPLTLGARVRDFSTKVVRYPGHAAQFRAFRDLGLFGEEPVLAGDSKVVPREVFHALLEPKIRADGALHDVVLARAIARGDRAGEPADALVDFRADADEALGFTAMQRSTGWHAAIVMHRMASGRVAPGVTPVELAIEPEEMIDELRRRDFDVRATVTVRPGARPS